MQLHEPKEASVKAMRLSMVLAAAMLSSSVSASTHGEEGFGRLGR